MLLVMLKLTQTLIPTNPNANADSKIVEFPHFSGIVVDSVEDLKFIGIN